MYDAWKGVGIFEGKPFQGFRVLEYLTDQAVSVVTLTRYPIKTFKDLEGKKVSIGPPGSGGVVIAHAIFKALGLTDKVKISMLTFQQGAQALKDGQIDVSMTPGGPYVLPPILEISRTQSIRMVEPTVEEGKKIEAEMPYLYAGVIPPGKAPGENADRERRAIFWSIFWGAQTGMSDQVVYDMLKVTQEPKNKEMLGKILNYWLTASPNFSSLVKVGVPIHPGAVKFWKEKGAKLPPELLK
jgi:TRAP transporter TAXI family solute receptor